MARRDTTTMFGHLAETLTLISQGQPGHIVDTLIAERGGRMMRHPLWPVLRPFLYMLLRYDKAIEFADAVGGLPGFQVFEHLSQVLQLDLRVTGEERIPKTGGFLLVCNHPTGIADGVAVFDLMKHRRPDMMFFANRDAIRVNPRLSEIVIPVEWREEFKTKLKARETLQITNRAIEEEKATILFPSGRIAYWQDGKLNERPWKTSAVSMARRYGLPILPVHMSARNSTLFYWFARLANELRDITVFHELLNKKRQRFELVVGDLIPIEHLEGDPAEVTRALEFHSTHALSGDANARFVPLA